MRNAAESEGFEPPVACATPVFKTSQPSQRLRALGLALGWYVAASGCARVDDDGERADDTALVVVVDWLPPPPDAGLPDAGPAVTGEGE